MNVQKNLRVTKISMIYMKIAEKKIVEKIIVAGKKIVEKMIVAGKKIVEKMIVAVMIGVHTKKLH